MSDRRNHRSMIAPIGLLMVSFVLVAAPAGRAEAGFEVGNLDSSGGFNSLNGYNLIGPVATPGPGYGIAVRFTVGSQQSFSFDSAQLGLSYRGGTDALNISLMQNTGGLPGGTPLETIHLANIAAGPNLVTITSTLHPVLMAGISYWLVANYGGSDTNIAWLDNSTGQLGHAAYRADTTGGTGSWTGDGFDLDPSFAIFGTNIVANAGTVDAPPSGVLVGLGCLGLIGGQVVRCRRSDGGLPEA